MIKLIVADKCQECICFIPRSTRIMHEKDNGFDSVVSCDYEENCERVKIYVASKMKEDN